MWGNFDGSAPGIITVCSSLNLGMLAELADVNIKAIAAVVKNLTAVLTRLHCTEENFDRRRLDVDRVEPCRGKALVCALGKRAVGREQEGVEGRILATMAWRQGVG